MSDQRDSFGGRVEDDDDTAGEEVEAHASGGNIDADDDVEAHMSARRPTEL